MAAVVIGGMLASAVIKETTRKLGSAITGEIKLHLNFKRDLEGLKVTLESIEAVLEDAERRSINEKRVQLWLKRLKDASYDISDILDEFEALAARKRSIVVSHLRKVTMCTMAHKMKHMKLKLKDIADQYHNFGFKQGSSSSRNRQVPDRRQTSSTEYEGFILGRTEEKQKFIRSCLYDNINNKITILPIYGMGGIGKTTFARMIFNDTKFKDYSQVWVYVSQTFDLGKIGNSIISQVRKEEIQISTAQMINNFLGELHGNKILIVLDDLWEIQSSKLNELKSMLELIGNGSTKVIAIVTTRDKEIAHKICTVEPIELLPLTGDMCWTIIKQKAEFEDKPNKQQLEPVGKEIALKCGGVALAAQSLGYMLRSMADIHSWESVRDNDIWNVFNSEDRSSQHRNVISSLMLSYNSMPPYLKLCFAYCATFEKGHKIVKDDLIYQWISLGFIEPQGIFSTWENGENYASHLMGMSFLQYAKSPSTAGVDNDDDVTQFIMHDLVHDLARLVMADEILDSSKNDNTNGSSCRYVLLKDCSKRLESSIYSPAKIRALRYLQFGIVLHDKAFSSAKYLRVLDLSQCSIHNLPDSIGHLNQLRYLNAPRVQHERIPGCITKLFKLMYLSLRGSSKILALPKSIGEMEGLMYLDLSCCSSLKELPASFDRLTKLVHLDLSNCSAVTGVSESLECLTHLEYLNLSFCKNIGKLPETLDKLTKLEYLNLSCCSYIDGITEAEVLGTFTKLEYLNLSTQASDIKRLSEALSTFTNLKYLNLSGFKELEELPKSFGNLKSLKHLDLSNCAEVKGITEALVGLTELQFLNLSHCYKVIENDCHIRRKPRGKLGSYRRSIGKEYHSHEPHCLFDFIKTLSNLEHLNLSKNENLYILPDCFGSLRKLHTLDISGCTYLERIPASIGEIDCLKFLHMDGCIRLTKSVLAKLNKTSIISLPHFLVKASDNGSSSNIVLLQDVNPPKLEISGLENVRSLKEVQIITLVEKEKIEQLKLEWHKFSERFVDDMELLQELVPPTTLNEIDIRGYNCAEFPFWLMGIALHLPNLARITMEGLPKCTRLPPFGQLPNLKALTIGVMESMTKIDGDIYGGQRAPFPRLESFCLRDMESLEVWITACIDPYLSTAYCSISGHGFSELLMFFNLRELTISNCPRLRLAPAPPIAENWAISRSDRVITSWADCVQDTTAASSSYPRVTTTTTALQVDGCNAHLHQWRLLHHLPVLNSLSITCCSDLTISPEIMAALCSLQTLKLTSDYFQAQAPLPGWLAQLTSLQKLEICRFEVNAPMEDIKHLTSLQEVSLDDCVRMTTLPRWVGDLTSLKKLKISFCRDLNNLQENIGRLNSLQELLIRACRNLHHIPESLECLISLKNLEIDSCDDIGSLPAGIGKLTNLKSVSISRCPKLKLWCELDENRRMLTNVKEMKFFDCQQAILYRGHTRLQESRALTEC